MPSGVTGGTVRDSDIREEARIHQHVCKQCKYNVPVRITLDSLEYSTSVHEAVPCMHARSPTLDISRRMALVVQLEQRHRSAHPDNSRCWRDHQ